MKESSILPTEEVTKQKYYVTFSPNNKLLAIRQWESEANILNTSSSAHNSQKEAVISIWDISTAQFITGWTVTSEPGSRQNIAFSPQGNLLASPSDSQIIL